MISATPRAASKIVSNLSRRGSGVGIRLGTTTTGCSGFAYVLEYVDALQPVVLTPTLIPIPLPRFCKLDCILLEAVFVTIIIYCCLNSVFRKDTTMDFNRRECEFRCNFNILNCASLLQRFTLDPFRDE